MTQMQITQGVDQLTVSSLPISGAQRRAHGSQGSFARMMGGRKAEEASTPAEEMNGFPMSPTALFVPGLFPQAMTPEASPEAAMATRTLQSVADAPAQSGTAEGTLWTLPEPGRAQSEWTPKTAQAQTEAPLESIPQGPKAAENRTDKLPEFRLVQADKAVPGQTEVPTFEQVETRLPDEQQPVESSPFEAPRSARFSEADPAKRDEPQGIQTAEERPEQPARQALKTEENASANPEHEQPDKQPALAPPLPLSRFLLERSAAVRTAEQPRELQASEPVLQLAEEVKVFAQQGSGRYVVELTPHELGRVTIELELKDGAVKLSYKAENPATQSLLAAGTGALKTSLENALARPVTLNSPNGQDADYRGQETFREGQNPKNQENHPRRQRPREAFSGVIGRIRAG